MYTYSSYNLEGKLIISIEGIIENHKCFLEKVGETVGNTLSKRTRKTANY